MRLIEQIKVGGNLKLEINFSYCSEGHTSFSVVVGGGHTCIPLQI